MSSPAFSAATISAASVGSPSTLGVAGAFELRVVAQRADAQRQPSAVRLLDFVAGPPFASERELPFGGVARARDLDAPPATRKRAPSSRCASGFPSCPCRSPSSNRAPPPRAGAHERVHARHALHPDRERHRGHGQQTLGHRRDRQGDADLDHQKQVVAAKPADQHDDHAQHQHDDEQSAAELRELPSSGVRCSPTSSMSVPIFPISVRARSP
jgi:hypothetical protein